MTTSATTPARRWAAADSPGSGSHQSNSATAGPNARPAVRRHTSIRAGAGILTRRSKRDGRASLLQHAALGSKVGPQLFLALWQPPVRPPHLMALHAARCHARKGPVRLRELLPLRGRKHEPRLVADR